MSELTIKEKNALRTYVGDVSGDGAFFGNNKAYVTLNSLFFPGISAERSRAAEGKPLDPSIVADAERLNEFFRCLFSAFSKCRLSAPVTTYRVERLCDFELLRSRRETVSMTSTSTAGFLDSYRDRRGIALIKFELAEGTNAVDMAKVLDIYAKPEEAEILLPPFLPLELNILPVPEELRHITDCDNAPPQVYCTAKTFPKTWQHKAPPVFSDDTRAAVNVLTALSQGKEPSTRDTELYCRRKKLSLNG